MFIQTGQDETKSDLYEIRMESQLSARLSDEVGKVETKMDILKQRLEDLEKAVKNSKPGVPTQVSTHVRQKTSTFDGQQQWELYKGQFQACAAINGWTTEEKCVAVMLALKGMPENERPNYHRVCSALQLGYRN